MDFKIFQNNISSDSLFILQSQEQKGFNLGIVSNLRLGRNSDLRFLPTLSFVSRRINYFFNFRFNNLICTWWCLPIMSTGFHCDIN